MSFISRFLDVKKGEKKPLLILFIHFFCFSAISITSGAARDAFFLSQYEKSYLPLMFVIIAVVMVVVIPLYIKISRKTDLITNMMITGVVFGGTLSILSFTIQGFIIPLIYVWVEIMIILFISQFWQLAGQVFDARQAKRLFGVISGSGAIASIAVGSGIRPFVQIFGSEKLLFATSFFIAITMITVHWIKPYQLKNSGIYSSKTSTAVKSKFDDYLIALTVVICAMAFVSKIVDYQFKITAANQFTSQDALVNFFGMFYAVTGAAAFLVQFFLTGRILSKYGVFIGLIILPLGLFAGSAGFLAIPVLATIFIPKFADQVFKFTINNATIQLLWLPVPVQTKTLKKPVIEGSIKTLMEGFAGISIFIAAKWIPLHMLSIAVLLMAGLWIFYTYKIKSGYVKTLQKAIEKRQLNFEEIEIDVADHAMVNTIEKALKDTDEVKQLFALELIEDIPLTPWAKSLNEMFHGKSVIVSKGILKLAAENTQVISNPEIIAVLKRRELAITAMTVAGRRKIAEAIPILESYLIDEDPELQVTAAATLQLLGSEKEEVNKIIQHRMNSDDPKIQAMAIRHLVYHEEVLANLELIKLLAHHSEITRKAALYVAEKRKSQELIPAVISNLANPKTLPTAKYTLQHFPRDPVIQELQNTLIDPSVNPDLLRGIIIAIRLFQYEKFPEILINLLGNQDSQFEIDNIDTLLVYARQNEFSATQKEKIHLEIWRIAHHAYCLSAFLNGVNKVDSDHLLNEVTKHTIAQQIPLLLKLGVIDVPSTPIESYLQTIKKHDLDQMPFVFELLDNIFKNEEKELIVPLVENIELEKLTTIGRKHFAELPVGIEPYLLNMINGSKNWSSAVALDFALKHQFYDLLQQVNWEQIAPSFAVKEVVNHYELKNGLSNRLSNFTLKAEEKALYTTLEKTILLKTVNLFQSIPTEELSKVAYIAEEVQYNAHARLFAQGDHGDSLYIVMDGNVKIHKGDRHIASLGKGACLGEMALLDQEPRSADVTIESDATLLKITQDDFYEIMSSNTEIMQGIIKLLTGRLRKAIN